ncbi:MAG: sensor histidine kinase [Ferrovum sp. 37-45-19]|uniref:ATP-binding protein n=1 Tax=Ferrovum sp. JA12 TaxID=1356299 RepID=UPI000703B662|nr:ATP-binding protein [Ferrovum sp. JA12]OYV78809.1 MAG: sensor histidine kinase [Ferrovum sp. 21-44-67]OYV93476.1 MAG: sensor histidine kinase [Ferrovum sp. 37-45-19]OZB34499.1 MAG: sensor histidine kinase [Ferrovum sp. 34-44-207]HQT82244.1 ATP-binding protein [Ferrovaceae bacterium]KRH79406.1 alginate biosynthesis sensor protein KinB [Ferrovum sp. JA12]
MKTEKLTGFSWLKWFVLVSAVFGVLLLYLLSEATGNTSLFAQNYPRLLAIGAGVALILVFLILVQLLLFYKKIKAKVFGSKLTLKLLMIFILMAIIPGTLVYGVSVKFLSNSIESWFDVNVDKALTAGLDLGRTTYDTLLNDLTQKAETMAQQLSEASIIDEGTMLYHLREQSGVQEATLFSKTGAVLSFASAQSDTLVPEALPTSSNMMHQIRTQRPYKMVESRPGKGQFLRVVVPVNTLSFEENLKALQVIQPISKELAQEADSVEAAYRGYQELLLARAGLKRIYALNLSLVLLLSMLSAIISAFIISEKISAPLGLLAEITKVIGLGDYSRKIPVISNDELGMLSQSFNTMTEKLKDTSEARERAQEKLTEAKQYQENILSNLSTGVIVLDERLVLKSANVSANEILGIRLIRVRHVALQEWGHFISELTDLSQYIEQRFAEAMDFTWDGDIDVKTKGGMKKIHFRGSRLPGGNNSDYVLVFDDITKMVQAQRDAAWAEVARRLAHEIKNPLTPIQLSAERLRLKLSEKLPPTEQELLNKSITTIVNQVDALKNMVNDFSEYARSSATKISLVNINDLILEIMGLYESNGEQITLNLTHHLPLIKGDPQRLRQVIHNLLQNALDALQDHHQAKVTIMTNLHENKVVLCVSDNGPGFSEEFLTRIFEPYVTTKVKGTGLGLAIVKKIIEEHQGSIEAGNLDSGGAVVNISFPMAEKV